MPRRLLLFAVALALSATACAASSSTSTSPASGAPASGGSVDPSTFAAQVASPDLYVGPPQAVQIGVFSSDAQSGVSLLTSGTIDMQIGPYQGGSGTPTQTTAHYVPAPGTAGSASGTPALTTPDVARGVYQADDVKFDAPGVWQAQVSFTLDGTPVQLSTQFQVKADPALPAPGQDAFRTQNLTMSSKVDPQAIDSRAIDGAKVPDPELHQHTIAQAIAAGKPALVLFSTPVYCQSQFCGPSTDALEQIAKAHPNEAYYIHVEIWGNYAKGQINAAAKQWLYRNGDLTEPWLFLIGPDGKIAQRWGPLFDPQEVVQALDRVANG
ncbi:MAG: TlpA family protein disulfide reductase [Planctomycetaceae bacterium]